MAKQVILLEDVPGLGDQGQVVRVSDGYARNFLLPRNLAAPVTEATKRVLEKKRKEYEARKAADREQAQQVADAIKKAVLVLPVKVGAEDRLYGSVTVLDIVAAAQKQGLSLDKKQVQLAEPLRELGEHAVPVKLLADLQVDLRVMLVKE